MKKLNFVIFGALMLTCLVTRAFAETTIPWTKAGCESVKGTWITAHSATDDGCDAAHCNGLNFCTLNVNNNGLNWWSALIWCKSIGRELASIEDACPNGLAGSGICANLPKGTTFWTTTSKSNTEQYVFDWQGSIKTFSRSRAGRGTPYPLCK